MSIGSSVVPISATFDFLISERALKSPSAMILLTFSQISGKDYWGGGHKHVLFDFYNALEQKGNSYIDLNDSINTMKTMFAIYKSANSKGEYVTL